VSVSLYADSEAEDEACAQNSGSMPPTQLSEWTVDDCVQWMLQFEELRDERFCNLMVLYRVS
jgi:hypothetical protein